MTKATLQEIQTIQVKITLNSEKEPKFSYWKGGKICDGNVVVESPQIITYELIESDGFVFVGAGFINPFDGIIDAVTVADNGRKIFLVDYDNVSGVTKFQLILRHNNSGLLLISPDPQITNRNQD